MPLDETCHVSDFFNTYFFKCGPNDKGAHYVHASFMDSNDCMSYIEEDDCSFERVREVYTQYSLARTVATAT